MPQNSDDYSGGSPWVSGGDESYENFDTEEYGDDSYLDDSGAAAYIGASTYMTKRKNYARPSDAEIEASKMEQRHSTLQNFSASEQERDEHDEHHGDKNLRSRPDVESEIEKSKLEQSKWKSHDQWNSQDEQSRVRDGQPVDGQPVDGQYGQPVTSGQSSSSGVARSSGHVRPSNEEILSSMNVSSDQRRRGGLSAHAEGYGSGEGGSGEGSSRLGSGYGSGEGSGEIGSAEEVSDRDYLLKYFPGALEVYNYDENGHIICASDVSLADRKIVKRAICGHWYFFTYGCAANEEKAKHLSNKLAKIKPDLNLASHIKKKVTDTQWLK